MQDSELTTAPIPKMIRKMAIPTALGFLFQNIFNATDQYFAGKLGTAAQAGVGVTFPLLVLIMTVSAGVANGITALASNSIGAKEMPQARAYILQGNILAFFLAILLTIFGHYYCENLLLLLNVKGQTFYFASAFIKTIFSATIFFVAAYSLNAGLSALGNTKPFRSYMMIAALLNLILDPIFMYGWGPIPQMGIYGLALATDSVQLVGAIYLGKVLFSHQLLENFSFHELKPKFGIMLEVAKYGFPATLNLLTVAAGAFIFTYFVNQFGESATAAFAISFRIEQIILLPAIGLNVAALSITGQNFGAKNYTRVRQLYALCLKYAFYICLAGGLFLFLFKKNLIEFFNADPVVVSFGQDYINAAVCTLFSYSLIWISVSTLQGLKQPMFVVWISLYRQIVAPLIVLTIASKYFGFSGVVWGFCFLTASAALLTFIYTRYVLSKLPIIVEPH